MGASPGRRVDMTKEEFQGLFEAALEIAATNAEHKLGHKVPKDFQCLVHGAGHSGELMNLTTSVNSLYLGADRFYRIIDVAVIEVSEHTTTVFVRASAHPPGSFEQTWNTPPGSGPFKQLIAKEIKISK